MIELYNYQGEITKGVRSKWAGAVRRLIVQSPTGSGKTVIFSWIAQQTSLRNKRILILTHREELLQETGGTLSEFDIHPALITSETKNPPQNQLVSVAMTATLKNRLKREEWKRWFDSLELIIIDEAHQQDFDWVFEFVGSTYVLGFTATPKRINGQRQLSDLYECIVSGPDVQELINMGYLVPDKYFGAPVNLKGVSKDSFGEYKNDELFDRYNKTELYAGVVQNWQRLTPGTLTIIFCVNIQHCINTARAFNNAGIKAKFVTSDVGRPELPTTPDDAFMALYEKKMRDYQNWSQAVREMSGNRKEVVGEWKRREFLILINAGIFTTGFNHKPIETVVINRATTSENLWLQMIGRGSRPSPGKSYFNLLDFGENATRLGHYRQQREFSLSHFVGGKKDGVTSVKECPQCGALVLTSSKFCKYCAWEFQKSQKEKQIELIQQTFEELSAAKAIAEMRTAADIEIAAELKGYKKAWVWRQIYHKLGKDIFVKYMRARNYQWAFIYRQIGTYGKV